MPASFFSKIIPALSSTEHTLAEQSVQGSRNGIYIFATFAAWREIYNAINICEKDSRKGAKSAKIMIPRLYQQADRINMVEAVMLRDKKSWLEEKALLEENKRNLP